MSPTRKGCRWGALGHSQLGVSHVRQGLPNQDAIRFYVLPDGSPPTIVALADGHGSANSFRSDVGARLAVETAVQVCQDFLEGIGDAVASTVKNAAEQQVPPLILRAWRRRVTDHFAKNPFTEAELSRLTEQAGAAARDRAAVGDQPALAYGATLLAALLTDEFLICFQLGDGEILAVSDVTDEVSRLIPKDESLIANETSSLCQDDALKYVRFRFQLFQEHPPGLLLLSTDGYPNSFVTHDAFLKVGTDYLDLLRSEGADAVQKNLPLWLDEASRQGSGDDITLGIIYRREPALTGTLIQTQRMAAAVPASPDGPPTDKSWAGPEEVEAPSLTDKIAPNAIPSLKPGTGVEGVRVADSPQDNESPGPGSRSSASAELVESPSRIDSRQDRSSVLLQWQAAEVASVSTQAADERSVPTMQAVPPLASKSSLDNSVESAQHELGEDRTKPSSDGWFKMWWLKRIGGSERQDR